MDDRKGRLRNRPAWDPVCSPMLAYARLCSPGGFEARAAYAQLGQCCHEGIELRHATELRLGRCRRDVGEM